MIARIISFAGGSAGLLAAQPNWDTEVKVSLQLPTDVSKEPITLTESRRNFAQSARYTMEWRSYLSNAADSTELRMFLTRLRSEPVLVPLWPDMCELAVPLVRGQTVFLLTDLPVRYGVNWIIADDNFTNWEIVVANSLIQQTNRMTLAIGVHNAWAKGSLLYPLIMGRLSEQPKPEAITDETLEVDFKLKESSQFNARVSPAPTTLTQVGSHIPRFATLPIWNIAPTHVRPLDWTEMPDVIYEQVGFLRQEQQRVYDHRNQRGLEFEFYQNTRAMTQKAEYFWRDRRATTLRLMIPTYRGDLRMLANTPTLGHPTWIRCEQSQFSGAGRETQPGDPFVALIDANDAVNPYQLTSAVDAGTETRLVSTVNVSAHTATTAIVSHLLLARFADATLEWTYTTPYLSTTRIKFLELPHEYENTPVALPEPAYLFIFTEAGIRTDRYTSYENTIQVPAGVYAGTYTPAPFSFNTVKVGLKLDAEKLELKSFKFLGNPLNKMWPFALDGMLTVEIVEVNAVSPNSTTAVSRFYGDVWSIDSSYKATLVPFGNFFERKFPRFLLSVSDNYTQFSEPTKLPASAFKVSGGLQSLNYQGDNQAIVILAGPVTAKPVDYFAGGWLEAGSGVTKEKRGILHSAGNVFHIDRPLLKNLKFATPIDFYPGYDGSIDQCETKFNNRVNFGGHPFIPNVNPGVKAITPQKTAGGKKG